MTYVRSNDDVCNLHTLHVNVVTLSVWWLEGIPAYKVWETHRFVCDYTFMDRQPFNRSHNSFVVTVHQFVLETNDHMIVFFKIMCNLVILCWTYLASSLCITMLIDTMHTFYNSGNWKYCHQFWFIEYAIINNRLELNSFTAKSAIIAFINTQHMFYVAVVFFFKFYLSSRATKN